MEAAEIARAIRTNAQSMSRRSPYRGPVGGRKTRSDGNVVLISSSIAAIVDEPSGWTPLSRARRPRAEHRENESAFTYKHGPQAKHRGMCAL